MKNSLSIYIIMHKYVNLTKLNLELCYKNLLVGKRESEDRTLLLDSTGDNISEKNKYYCELTGLYWIWKNVNDKFVGLCHYRRLFFYNSHFLNSKDIKILLKNHDMIVPSAWFTRKNLYDTYKCKHIIEDLDLCRDIIEENYPSYIESFDKIINGHKFYPFNMFVCEKKIIDDYCEWLFNILKKLELNIDLNNRDEYQKRVFGFLSERLFNVWIDFNNIDVFECRVFNTEKKVINNIKSIVLRKIRSFIYRK